MYMLVCMTRLMQSIVGRREQIVPLGKITFDTWSMCMCVYM